MKPIFVPNKNSTICLSLRHWLHYQSRWTKTTPTRSNRRLVRLIGVSQETRKSPLQRAGEGIFSCELDEREGEGQALQAEQGSFDSFLEGYPRAIIGVLKGWITDSEGDTYWLG